MAISSEELYRHAVGSVWKANRKYSSAHPPIRGARIKILRVYTHEQKGLMFEIAVHWEVVGMRDIVVDIDLQSFHKIYEPDMLSKIEIMLAKIKNSL
jgi:hypothetical protein